MSDKKAMSLMFQGTGSDVGKSLLVAGLCRAFLNRGLSVAPFKPQNMSNNAAVTSDGGEIGRAQALQAAACRLEPTTDMNPVLLKPQDNMGSQLIVRGKVQGTYRYKDYMPLKPQLLETVLESFQHLKSRYDLVLVEGAGSAAEVNLRKGDIANMGFALASNTPVVLIGDIDRGGVIASLVGTSHLISPEERTLLKGYLINKFRGDVSLFDDALDIIKQKVGLDCFGVVPFFEEARQLPDEDAMSLDNRKIETTDAPVKVAVLRYPRIANFDDLDPLFQDPRVDIQIVGPGDVLDPQTNMVILPGSKATISDLDYLYDQGWHIDLKAHLRRGGFVMGLCGGYQMMGRFIEDPDKIEGTVPSIEALGLFEMTTVMKGPKTLTPSKGRCLLNNTMVEGYEMHMGDSSRIENEMPFLELNGKHEGHMSGEGKIMGTYLHGIFHSNSFRNEMIQRISNGKVQENIKLIQQDAVLDSLAEHLEKTCKLDQLIKLA